jgi:hypothetical protein
MEATSTMKNSTEEPTYITFKGTNKLPDNHPFRDANYFVQYIKNGTPHFQILKDRNDTIPNKSK